VDCAHGESTVGEITETRLELLFSELVTEQLLTRFRLIFLFSTSINFFLKYSQVQQQQI